MPSVILPDRALLRISGPDAASFLQGLITQDVAGLDSQHWRWAALLSPQGKLLFDFLARRDDTDIWLDVEAARRAELIKRLTLYKLRAQVMIAAEETPVIAGWGLPLPAEAAIDQRHAALGWRGSGSAADDNMDAYRQHRWSLGIAEGADELGVDRLLWLEANATELGGVSFTKGCYVGQENTARMHHKARVRKRIMMFQSHGRADILMAGERAAGDVLCQRGEHGIALLRLDYVDTLLTLDGEAVTLLRPSWLEPHLKSD